MRYNETDETLNNDLEYLARTMWGEARGEGKNGMLHVGSVVLNRTRDRRFPSSIRGVVLQPSQFYVWQGALRHRTSSVTPNDPLFRLALEAARELLESGPINNYLYFENRRLNKKGVVIGNHRFR